MTGFDPMADFKGKYKTPREAVKEIQRAGGLANILTEYFGEPIEINFISRGDLVQYKNKTVGICVGSTAAFLSPNGLEYIEMTKMIKGWKI